MKKQYMIILPGLGVLLGIYSVLAAKAVRGIGVYTMSSGMGQFLSVSRHYTAIAAAILILIFAAILTYGILKNRKNKADLRSDKTDAADSVQAPAIVEEVPVTVKETTATVEEVPATVKEAPDKAENLVPESPKEQEKTSEKEVRKCKKCGAPLKDGANFCVKCGERVSL